MIKQPEPTIDLGNVNISRVEVKSDEKRIEYETTVEFKDIGKVQCYYNEQAHYLEIQSKKNFKQVNIFEKRLFYAVSAQQTIQAIQEVFQKERLIRLTSGKSDLFNTKKLDIRIDKAFVKYHHLEEIIRQTIRLTDDFDTFQYIQNILLIYMNKLSTEKGVYSKETYERKFNILERFMLFMFGKKEPLNIKESHIKEYVGLLVTSETAKETKRNTIEKFLIYYEKEVKK